MNIDIYYIDRNYTPGRSGAKIEITVGHTYNGKGKILQGWFNNPIAQVSAHYSVHKDGTIAQYVREEDTAWHAGQWEGNIHSIGIEHQDDGNPGDSVRTNEQYESSAQLIADIYRRYKLDINNQGLIKPHKEFTSTGCPGGLDITRIRNRVYEILHPEPPIPAWKKEAKDIGAKTFVVEKNVELINFETNKPAGVNVPEGGKVGVRYLTRGYYMTESSYNGNRPTGFKKEDLEYKKPEPPKPDLIVYTVSIGADAETFDTVEKAQEYYNAAKKLLKPGESIDLLKVNLTKQENDKLIPTYTEPIPEPEPQPEPTKPSQNGIRWLANILFNFLKSIYEWITRKHK